MQRRGWLLTPLVAVGCAVSPPPAVCTLRWRIEPDGAGGVLELRADGAGTLRHWPNEAEDAAAVREALVAAPARAQLVAAAAPRLREQPRWLHVSGTFAGARLWIDCGGKALWQASGAVESPVRALLGDLASTDVCIERAFTTLLAAPAGAGRRFAFSPGDPPEPLAAILGEAGSDIPLRHLAARIAIDERAFLLVPKLRAAFDRSREADGRGDYFLASTLLRLGDPVGLSRVVDVLGSSRSEWAAEATADLAACLPAEAVASPELLLEWWRVHGERLQFDQVAGRYRDR